MARLYTVSQELLTVSSSRLLGADILSIVEKIKADYASGYTYVADIDKIATVITKHTGIPVKAGMYISPYINVSATVTFLHGHQGISGLNGDRSVYAYEGKWIDEVLHSVKVDLDKATVSGTLVKDAEHELSISSALFGGGEADLTPEEITAIILHEVGHMFTGFMTLGDYIFLNYLLTEGVEVTLGKRANRLNIEVLNTKYLAKLVKDSDSELAMKLLASPTEEDVRRAVLTTFRLLPRHHLSSADTLTSKKRSEQMADLFASRMGFGRALITGTDKVNRAYKSRHMQSRTSFAIAEIGKVLIAAAGVVVFPIAPQLSTACLVSLLFMRLTSNDDLHERIYDNDAERLIKVRKDLVAQFKQFEKEPSMRAKLDADIQAVDKLLADYNQHRTLFEYIGQLLRADKRRKYQLHRQEETLEKLLNNDLFLQAYRISKLGNKEA